MPRNGSGTYTLPAGNPVVEGTDITPTWGNTTMSDIATALTDSLSRSGQGGMSAAFQFFSGTVSNPGLGFTNQPSTGIFLNANGDMRVTVAGTAIARFNTGFEILDGSTWKAPLLDGDDTWAGPIGIGMTPGITSLSVADNFYVGLDDQTLGIFMGEIAGSMFIITGEVSGDEYFPTGTLNIASDIVTIGGVTSVDIGDGTDLRARFTNKVLLGDVDLGFETSTTLTVNGILGDTNVMALKTVLGSGIITALNNGTVNLPVTASTTTASAANLFINSSTGALARSTSSARYKENILPYTRGLTTVSAMNPVSFNGIGESVTRAGFIAEDFDTLGLTEFVNYTAEGQPDSIDYPNLTALLVKAVQELSAQVDSLLSP
jgi:hypothetical protein